MYESSDLQSLSTTTGIQSGLDAFDLFIRNFLMILAVTKKLHSFKLVLEGKSGKGITESSRLEFLEKSILLQTILLYQMQKATSMGH